MSAENNETVHEPVEAVEHWLSPSSVGLRLRISREWAKQLCVRGELRSVFTELGYLIDPASVEAYAQERERMSTTPRHARRRIARRDAYLSESQTH